MACVGKSKCECNFEWQPKGCEAVNTQHDSQSSPTTIMHYHWDGAQAQHVLEEEEDDAAAAAMVRGCRRESGRVRSWGHLTTPFFLASFSYHQVSPWWCSLRYAVQGEARRGCCRSPMKPWSLGRAHPIVMMVIMPLFCTHSIPADFSAKRTCWPLL